ncbi:MAG: hypothetical protein ABL949_14440 [Fimbriimonadaceae bacterium]
MGLDELAREPDAVIWTYPARSNERPFPSGCEPIIKEIMADYNRRLKPREPIAQMAMIQTSTGDYSVHLAYASGKSRASYTDSVARYGRKTVRVPKPINVEIPPLVENRMALAKLNPVGQVKPMPELIEALLDPVQTDPLELDAGPMFVDIARHMEINLIANPYPMSIFRLMRTVPPPYTNAQILNAVTDSNQLELDAEWLRVRDSSYGLIPTIDRPRLKAHLRAAWNAKSPDELAEALFASSAWPMRHQLEFMNGLPILFPSSTLPERSVPLHGHVAKARTPFRKAVRLSPEERAQLDALVNEHADSLFIPGPIMEGIQMGTGLEVTLDMLPSRLFPNGIPMEIEVQFEPAAMSSPRTIVFGLNEQMDEPKTLYAHGYAKHLVDLKVKPYKWFREQGTAGRHDNIPFSEPCATHNQCVRMGNQWQR